MHTDNQPHDRRLTVGVLSAASALMVLFVNASASAEMPSEIGAPRSGSADRWQSGSAGSADSGSSGIRSGNGDDGSVSPPGANQWGCRPSLERRPRPVILIHGTSSNQNTWNTLSPQLKNAGYCVYTLNYGKDDSSVWGAGHGTYATGDIRVSAQQLRDFISRVTTATSAQQVDIVAHSQGGLVARQYLRFEGGASTGAVHRLVTLGTPHHGTTLNGLGSLVGGSSGSAETGSATPLVGKAAVQQVSGSGFLANLNSGGGIEAGIEYTAVATRDDGVVTPAESAFLTPGRQVENLWLQDVCPFESPGHKMTRSPAIAHIVQKALDPAYSDLPTCGR